MPPSKKLTACSTAADVVAAYGSPDLTGRTAVVTGGASGIGVETARRLAAQGARVVLAVRNKEAGEKVAAQLKEEGVKGPVDVRRLDLADLASVKTFADGLSKETGSLDLLINNAGVMACGHAKTKDGFEMQMGTNHLGHYALTCRLLPLLEASKHPPARVVTVSSLAHKNGKLDVDDLNYESRKYGRMSAYGDSKLANALFARGLAARADPARLLAFSLHPGVIHTPLFRYVGGEPGAGLAGALVGAAGGVVRSVCSALLGFPAFKTTGQGAATSIYAALSPVLGAAQNGAYLADVAVGKSAPAATDDAAADALWAKSAALTGVGGDRVKRG